MFKKVKPYILNFREEAVGAQIEKVHEEESNLFYNTEQCLRSVIKRAMFTAYDHFVLFEELPAGSRFADIVYLPNRRSPYPIIVMELKWNESAKGAIAQIKAWNYPDAF